MSGRLTVLAMLCLALLGAAPRDAFGATVEAPLGGDTLALADGARVRLAGIATALPGAAAAALAERFSGREVALGDGPEGLDRHGRIVAHVVRADGLWAEGELLRLGLARVRTSIE